MAKVVITPEDIGKGLKIENSKVIVDIASLELPVDIHLSGVKLDEDNKKLVFTFTGVDTPVEVDIAQLFGTNTVVTSAALEDAILTIISSDGNTVSVDLGSLLDGLQAKVTSLENISEQLANMVRTAIPTLREEMVAKSELGDELVSLGGVKLGRLLRVGAQVESPSDIL